MDEPRRVWIPSDGDQPPPGEKRSIPIEGCVARDVVPFERHGKPWVSIHMHGVMNKQPRIVAFEIENFMGMMARAAQINNLELLPVGALAMAIVDLHEYLSKIPKPFKVGAGHPAAVLKKHMNTWAKERNFEL